MILFRKPSDVAIETGAGKRPCIPPPLK